MNPLQPVSNPGHGPGTAHPKPAPPKIPSYEFRMLLEARRSHVQAPVTRDEVRRLQDIDVALARIRARSYGICGDCGREIGRAGLKADPIATHRPPCQGRGEK